MVKVGKDFKLKVKQTAARRGVRTREQRGVRLAQFEFPTELDIRLALVAERNNLSKSDIVRGAVESALDALEK